MNIRACKGCIYFADYDEKNDILFVHLSPDNSNSYGEEIDKNIIIMRDMDSDEITGVMLYGFNKYVKNDPEKQSSIDAVPVIRCKDCTHSTSQVSDDEDNYYCNAMMRCMHSLEYCSRGERKES